MHLAGEGGRRDPVARRTELVDLAQVVLDRVAQRNHRAPCRVSTGGSRAGSATAPALLASRAVDVRVGHSPDPDDAFMYWALTTDLVDTRGFAFEQVLADIQTLNQWARAARLEVHRDLARGVPVRPGGLRAPSPRRLDRRGVRAGRRRARAGRTRRPRAVSRSSCPGAMTTAFLTLRLALGDVRLPRGRLRADPRRGRKRPRRRRAPDPRGSAHLLRPRPPQGARPRRVVAARDWPSAARSASTSHGATSSGSPDLSAVLRDAIACGLDNREEALEYALQFGRGIDAAVADRFVSMYVNDLTQGLRRRGPLGRSPSCCGAARRSAPSRAPVRSTGSRAEPRAAARLRALRRGARRGRRGVHLQLRVHVLRGVHGCAPGDAPERSGELVRPRRAN